MKKSTITIFFAFTISTFCFSQNFSKWQVGTLTEVGLGISNFEYEYDKNTQTFETFRFENQEKVKLGITLNYQRKYWFFETGLNYEERSNGLYEREYYDVIDSSILGDLKSHDMTTKSINLPFNLGFRIPTKFGNPYVQAGLYYNRMINSSYRFQPAIRADFQNISQAAFNQNSVGYQFYLGYQIPILKKIVLDLGVHYNQDFNYFTNDYFPNYDFKYRSLDWVLRWKYNL